jgi:hypothetical protein
MIEPMSRDEFIRWVLVVRALRQVKALFELPSEARFTEARAPVAMRL